jgi:hypothetical protein
MAHYIAFLDDNNLVTQVVPTPDDTQDWASIYAERHGCRCLTAARDGSIRHKYPYKGFTYHDDIDAFIEPSPYPSWVLNKTTKKWEAPVEMPDDGQTYGWDEATTSWVAVEPIPD